MTRFEIERSALLKDKEPGSSKRKSGTRLAEVERLLKEVKEKNDALSVQWHSEKIIFEKLQALRKKIDDVRREAEVAEREGNLDRVAAIRYGELPGAEKEYKAFERKMNAGGAKSKQAGRRFIKEIVDEEDIAAVVSRWTSIPVARMLESEAEKLTRIEEALRGRVVGQDDAIGAVANALRRSRAGLADEDRPAGSFMFLGPTGVGKTELARALAEFMFNDEKALIRIDMSEYMERHAVARLIGSPPGYVGYEEGGQLTEMVRHRPYSLILFDEIEKAHPEVFNILLQMLDNGRLTDGKGRRVNFRNSIIILTSNVGSAYFREMSTLGFAEAGEDTAAANLAFRQDAFRERVQEALRETFRPEFLNRLDEIITFNTLSQKDMGVIVEIQLKKLSERLLSRGIQLTVKSEVKQYLAKHGFDPDYGARPVKRLIQKMIVDALADRMIRGDVQEGKRVRVSLGKADTVEISS